MLFEQRIRETKTMHGEIQKTTLIRVEVAQKEIEEAVRYWLEEKHGIKGAAWECDWGKNGKWFEVIIADPEYRESGPPSWLRRKP